jgi:hypothetical protein
MSEKARKRFSALHEAYEKARTTREYSAALSRNDAVDEVATTLSSEEGLARFKAQLEALGDERKALRKLVKYARKHNGELAPPKVTTISPTPIRSGKRAKAAPAG